MRVLLRVSRQDSHRVQQQSGSTLSVLRTSKASGVLFSTAALDALSATWKALKQSHRESEQALVLQLSGTLESRYARFLKQIVDAIVEVDLLMCFMRVSRERNFVRPRSISPGNDEWSLQIVNAFDPFSANGVRKYGYEQKRLPCEVKLSSTFGTSFLLLATEDAEANDAVLYAIGVIATLHQIGCFVPCELAELPVFDSIYLRTGAYDQQLFGHSTFMTEMVEMRRIFSYMTPTSLVLVDDLCRGTANGKRSAY